MTVSIADLRASRPEASEHAPYYGRYISQVPDGDIVDRLTTQIASSIRTLAGVDEARGGYRYAPDKWSIRQVVGHLADTERVFMYRALCVARGETNALPGFDENAYVANAAFDERTLASLVDEWRVTRELTLRFVGSLNPTEWTRAGTANGQGISVRALAWIAAGHELHHMALFKERYGVS